jgi:hypothetical protein
MDVDTKQHQRPEEHGQDEGQKFFNTGEHVAVSVRHHRTDDEIHQTKIEPPNMVPPRCGAIDGHNLRVRARRRADLGEYRLP